MRHEIRFEDEAPSVVSVLHEGEFYQAMPDNPNFVTILARLASDPTDTSILDLFDLERAVASHFERLSDRVTVSNGQVYFDGDVIHNSLTEQVIRFLNEGVEDWKPLVAFFDNVMQNPSENSREQLFEWLGNDESLTITSDGLIVGYKGGSAGPDGSMLSIHSAPASDNVLVDGVHVTGNVKNVDGSVITMPRSQVDPDLNIHCSAGLHIGTFRYANSFGSVVKQVHVHPRDVVSVTSDSNREKIRACRYEVVATVESKIESPLYETWCDDGCEDDFEFVEYDPYEDEVDPDEDYEDDVVVLDLTKATRWDTRQNYTKQERYPKGHPKAGQFVPKA